MKNKMSILIGGLLVALLAAVVVGATSVYAQDPSGALVHGGGPGGGRDLGLAGLQAAAEALDMTTDKLIAELQSGKTLEQIAEEAGVEYADVQAAIQTAREAEIRKRIQQAVDNGTITQENADWLLEGLEKGFLGGPGGFGFGGRRHGHGQGLQTQPAPSGTVTP
ncbi:MAG TPA: hypothetical protein VJ785_13230 [Anaerolineales bacterium]|nr:hypothetical protein [Anaerolineales bacterium]